jgi:hypothetical protein
MFRSGTPPNQVVGLVLRSLRLRKDPSIAPVVMEWPELSNLVRATAADRGLVMIVTDVDADARARTTFGSI